MTGKKRVLVMISSLGGGGAERVATRLSSCLAERGHEVFLMPFSKTEQPYPVSDRVHLVDYAPYDLRDRKPQPWQFLRLAHTAVRMLPRIVGLRRREGIDTILSMLLAPNILNVLAGGACKKVLCERNNPSKKGALRFALSKWAYAHADTVVFQTQYVRSLFSARVQRHATVIPNPVEVDCAAAPSEEQTKLIVSAGRLVNQKNHALLIRAFARFLETHPGYELRIYGKGPLRPDLEGLLGELGIAESARIEHFSDNLHECIANARMFVLSSNFEGMPNALLEAMAMGIACITTDYPSAREVVTGDASGIVVPMNDVEALSWAMSCLADDDDLCEGLAMGARKRAQDFSIDAIVPQWEAVL